MNIPNHSEKLTVEIKGVLKNFIAYWQYTENSDTLYYKIVRGGKIQGAACILFIINIEELKSASKNNPYFITLERLDFYPECCLPILIKGESKFMFKFACHRVFQKISELFGDDHIGGILIQDESEIECRDSVKELRRISLADVSALVFGQTWYQRMGAIPEYEPILNILETIKDQNNKIIAKSENELIEKIKIGKQPLHPNEKQAIILVFRVLSKEKNEITYKDFLRYLYDLKNNEINGISGCWLLNRLMKMFIRAYPEKIQSLSGSMWIFEKNTILEWNSPKVEILSGGGSNSIKMLIDNLFNLVNSHRNSLMRG